MGLISTRPPQLLNSTLHWASTPDNDDFRVRPRCSGKYRDSESTIDWFEVRHLSGAQGRFQSVDPENAWADASDPKRGMGTPMWK